MKYILVEVVLNVDMTYRLCLKAPVFRGYAQYPFSLMSSLVMLYEIK